MEVQFTIPDDLAQRLDLIGDDVERQILEVLAAHGYRRNCLTKPDLRRLLGFETSHEIDGFLKAHKVFDEYTLNDFEDERRALDSLLA